MRTLYILGRDRYFDIIIEYVKFSKTLLRLFETLFRLQCLCLSLCSHAKIERKDFRPCGDTRNASSNVYNASSSTPNSSGQEDCSSCHVASLSMDRALTLAHEGCISFLVRRTEYLRSNVFGDTVTSKRRSRWISVSRDTVCSSRIIFSSATIDRGGPSENFLII